MTDKQEYNMIKALEELSEQHATGEVESLGEWGEAGLPYQHITFKVNGKRYQIIFGEMPEE